MVIYGHYMFNRKQEIYVLGNIKGVRLGRTPLIIAVVVYGLWGLDGLSFKSLKSVDRGMERKETYYSSSQTL